MTKNPQQKFFLRILIYLAVFLKNIPCASRVFSFIFNNPLYKGVLIIGSGTMIAQMIGILSMPVITRLYTPSDLGVLAVYLSILSIVSIGATLRYEFAYPLPKDDKDAANLFGLCLLILLITTTILSLVIFFGQEVISSIFDLGAFRQYLLFLLVGFFGLGLYNSLSYWSIRQRDYKRITYTKVYQGVGGTVIKIALGILALGPIGLIIGQIVSQIAGIGTLGRVMWRKEQENLQMISLNGMKRVARIYRSFPIFNFPNSLAHVMSTQLPPIILLVLYNVDVAGFYALAHMLMVLPGDAILQSMGQAYLGEASKMVRERSTELHSLYIQTIRHLFIMSVPLLGITALCAPFVVPIVFGEVWLEAGFYCWPLGMMMIAEFVVKPTSKLPIYGYNQWMLIWDLTRLIVIMIGFYVCHLLGLSIIYTLTIYALICILFNFWLIQLNIKAIMSINRENFE